MAQMSTDGAYLFRRETYEVIGLCMKVHRKLGHGFLEAVYKEAIEIELRRNLINIREKRNTLFFIMG
jgi:GxxExxY protein